MSDVVVGTLRLRGAQARRLATVAATTLPAALERALADVADRRVETVLVPLDLDVTAYDDETLAVLWADAIRGRLLETAAEPGPDGGPDAAGPTVAPRPRPAVTTREVVGAARSWLAGVGEPELRLPVALLALGDPAVADRVAAELGDRDWARLLDLLGAVVGGRPAAAVAGGADTAPVTAASEVDGVPRRTDGQDAVLDPEGSADSAPRSAQHAAPTPDDPARGSSSAGAEPVLAAVATLAELVDEPRGASHLDPTTVTRSAGLVLLYPWLTDHCRRAVDLHPGLDPVAVREVALAVLVDPDRPTDVVEDPLVRLLAGHDPRRPPARPAPRVPLPHADEVQAGAERVLASYAALLPGFARSSPTFVRQAWIARLGVLDPDRDPVLLTAATHPLDVVLGALPYPLGLVRLPWSETLTVRFRP